MLCLASPRKDRLELRRETNKLRASTAVSEQKHVIVTTTPRENTLTLGRPLRPLSTCFISAPARQSGLRIEFAMIEPTYQCREAGSASAWPRHQRGHRRLRRTRESSALKHALRTPCGVHGHDEFTARNTKTAPTKTNTRAARTNVPVTMSGASSVVATMVETGWLPRL